MGKEMNKTKQKEIVLRKVRAFVTSLTISRCPLTGESVQPIFTAEFIAKKLSVKIHLITQALHRLNLEGLISQGQNYKYFDEWYPTYYRKIGED